MFQVQSAKQLMPLAEEFEMYKLRRACENVLHAAYEKLRREHTLGDIPASINEEYLMIADRYKFEKLLNMCIDEYIHCPSEDHNSVINMDTVSETVKLLILRRKLARLNHALEKERRYKNDAEHVLGDLSPRKKWTNKFGLY